tara:strand:- start:893 stop:1480 length:588 start_codon:yes stop_codon:yes gene_type:complete
MKIFLSFIILIFSFQSLSSANDIREFEIEGISVGDNLLKFVSEGSIKTQIEDRKTSVYYDNDYVSILLKEMRNKLSIYDDVKVVIKPNDQSYKIYALEGILGFNNIDECHKNQIKISDEIKNSLNLQMEGDMWNLKESRLPDSIKDIRYIDFNIKEDLSEGSFRTGCYDYKVGPDILMIIINSPEFDKYLAKLAT